MRWLGIINHKNLNERMNELSKTYTVSNENGTPSLRMSGCCTLADCTHETNNEEQKIKNAKRGDFKICVKCGLKLPRSKFSLIKNGTCFGKQRYRYAAWCIDCVKENELFKTCTICNEKLPKTDEYFNVKIIKQQNQSGLAVYHSFRHACKKCLNEKIAKYKRDEYWKDTEKARKELKRKYWKDPEKAKRKTQEWRDDNLEYLRKKDRKRVAELDDSWIASSIGIPVKDCPKELIETKKIVIKLKRELGLTHSTIAERNINNKYKKQWKQKEIYNLK